MNRLVNTFNRKALIQPLLCHQLKRWTSANPRPYLKTYLVQNEAEPTYDLIKKYAPILSYNSVIEKKRLLRGDYKSNCILMAKIRQAKMKEDMKVATSDPIPLTLKKYLDADTKSLMTQGSSKAVAKVEEIPVVFPFKDSNSEIDETSICIDEYPEEATVDDLAEKADEEVRKRNELMKSNSMHSTQTWMTAYDSYDDHQLVEYSDHSELEHAGINYGTPDPQSQISHVPCGGCGALLHCKDTSLPGYIPSEIFNNSLTKGGANLDATLCQRCYFLKEFNVALQVRVSPEDYPKVLATVSQKRGIVVLMVDLTDFPCSIWPGLADIFGRKMPIVVVGNKIDLLLKDSRDYLSRIEKTLKNYVKLSGFSALNIEHVALVSCKTGYGIEDLITRLNAMYRRKGDVYIVGCTNVGKSSLFNALLQSDYCKSQATDSIQRSTTSVWPGTTLNLLKFPIRRPAGYDQYIRHLRLQEVRRLLAQEKQLRIDQLRATRDPKYAPLVGRIGRTVNPHTKSISKTGNDLFHVEGSSQASGRNLMGINEKEFQYLYSKWCYDTPGVVQPDHITHLLTADELVLTFPKDYIMPRSFCLKPRSSLFIAGLSRLDFLDGDSPVRLTVFASGALPITVCDTCDAEEVYNDLLGTELFKVPIKSSEERIAKWPRLESTPAFTVTGEAWNKSAKDVVLSSSGWIALTGHEGKQYMFQAWTPERRGVHVRECLLPHAIAFKGRKSGSVVAYRKHSFYYDK